MSTRLPLPEGFGELYACPADKKGKTQQHAAAHGLLQQALTLYGKQRCLSIPEAPPLLTYGEIGKPGLSEYPDIHFNLSHCSGLAVCLLSDWECGVDAESIRKLHQRVAERVFSPEELAALARTEDQDLLFTRLWTLKEAYVKAIGIGISYPMRNISFRITNESITSNLEEAAFAQLLLPEHVVSVCVLKKQPEQPVICRDLSIV